MKRLAIISTILISALCFEASAAAVKFVSMSGLKSSPSDLINGLSLSSVPGAEFVKIGITFDQEEAISKVAVESCEKPFTDGIEFFFSPGFRSLYAEAGKKSLAVTLAAKPEKVRSVAIVFGNNSDFCIASIKVWDLSGKQLALKKKEPSVQSKTPEKTSPPKLSNEPNSTEVLKGIIDREYTNKENGEPWRYRFRSDGTFFIRGFSDDMNGSREFSALGTYKVIEQSKRKAKLELEGFRYGTPEPWDGVICTLECGIAEISDSPVKETLEVERTSAGALFMRNRSERSTRTLPFSDLKIRPSTLTE